jgi:ABC-type multidrug transport system ATPase subunit
VTLRTENLGKQYGNETWGIQDVSIELGEGIHGLLGPNGAGKSTLMGIDTKRSRDEFAVALSEIPRYESVRAVTTSADLWKLRPAFSMHMAFWRSS